MGNQAMYIFLICLLFVYLLLAAQYESFLLPMSVILSLPIGIFGALFFLLIMGLENNIYAQIAMIMLIGILGKNAILIIEFATLQQKLGKTPFEAAIEGAALLTYQAAWLRDVKGAITTREAAMAKLSATEGAQQVIDAAVQIFGGLGVKRGEVVERLYREIRSLRIYEGATEVQKLIIARSLLKEPNR